ncbi:MAG: hypothetical protein JOY68_03805 [Candidatus Dormibacteraeota bacterium]|nr:hypothetical protein [Candidatus Dormibacteraeota bacterium]
MASAPENDEQKIERLERMVEEQQDSLKRLTAAMRHIAGGGSNGKGTTTRRDMLRLAGAGVIGAAGAAALIPKTAKAANGDPLFIGNNDSVTNNATLPTQLDMAVNDTASSGYVGLQIVTSNTASSSPSSVDGLKANAVDGGTGVEGDSDSGYGVYGDSGSGYGVYGVSGTSNGVYGLSTSGTGVAGTSNAADGTGVWGSCDGSDDISAGVYGQAGAGIGVWGDSSGSGTGVMGFAPGGVDLKASGSGRLSQYNVNFDSAPLNGAAPGYTGYIYDANSGFPEAEYEIVRAENGEIWAAQYDAVEAAAPHPVGGYFWKRINTARFDNPDGSGSVFQPVRAVDTRLTTPLTSGETLTLQIAPRGSTAGVSGIPSTAIGVAGNVSCIDQNYTGFLTVFPGGAPRPGTSTLDFVPNGQAFFNSFICGLGTDGTISIFVSEPVAGKTVDVFLDITAYFQ